MKEHFFFYLFRCPTQYKIASLADEGNSAYYHRNIHALVIEMYK